MLGRVVGKARHDAPDVGIQLPRGVGELPGALQVVGGLHQRQHLDRGDLVAVLHDLLLGIEWTYIGLESVCVSAVVEVAVNCAACNP